MSMLKCTSQGCSKDLWRQGDGSPTPINSNATCASCHVVIFCVDHLRDVWADAQGVCPYCGNNRWVVRLLPNTRFSPQVQAAVLEAGGQVRMIEPEREPGVPKGSAAPHREGRGAEVRRSQPLGARGARAYGAATRDQSRGNVSEPTSNDSLPVSSAVAALRDPYAERSSAHLDPYAGELRGEQNPYESAESGRFGEEMAYGEPNLRGRGRGGYPAYTEDYQSGAPEYDDDPYRLYSDPYEEATVPKSLGRGEREERYEPAPREDDPQLGRERRGPPLQRLRREEAPPPTSPRRSSGGGRRQTQVGHPKASELPPRSWRLILEGDLPDGARGLSHGIAAYRDSEQELMIMDDDLITRTLKVEGEVVALAQSPRKRRYIVEVDLGDTREVSWGKGRDVQGFITNPYEEELSVFGVCFVDESHFVCFTERPDGRFELREGSFERARAVRLRQVGSSLLSPPIAPVACERAERVFMFKYIDKQGYLPICRRVTDGDDRVIGELTTEPRASTASRDAGAVAWIDQQGRVWLSDPKTPMQQVGESNKGLIALSHDGGALAWCVDQELHVYSTRRRQRERWRLERLPIALGWRSENL